MLRAVIDAGVRDRLLAWSARSGRRLPALARSDPWAILVLEVVSQQTQILRSIAAADRFVGRFPTPAALAAASPADAIREWAGLGYYRRAVMLREAAIKIVEEHRGEVPGRVDQLAELPGIGPYTSRAIALYASGVPVAPLDTNLRRVMRRFLGTDVDLQERADAVVGSGDPRAIVRALMDLASLVCRSRTPICGTCPLATACASAFAPEPSPVARARQPAPAFVGSRRWVRGRLIERLSAATDGEWLAVDELAEELPGVDAREAIRYLASDGLVELAGGNVRLSTSRGWRPAYGGRRAKPRRGESPRG
jgi:A/G-specific adenine glycosylase